MTSKVVITALFSAATLSSTTLFAGQVTIPNTFTAGTPARADEVNQNFTEVADAINNNDTRITTNTGEISTLSGRVDGSDAQISTNTSDISAINSTLSSHDSRIATLEAIAPQSNVQSGDLAKLLTGTTTVTANSVTVTGTGTLFTSELNVGDAIKIDNEVHTVSNISSDTTLILDAPHSTGAAGALAYTDNDLLSLKTGDAQEKLAVDKSGYLIRRMQRATGLGPNDPTVNGQIVSRVLAVNKSRSDTSLRIGYADNVRVYGLTTADACRYEIRVDGVSCPGGELVYDYYIANSGISRVGSQAVFGYCDGLSSGSHEVQVWVGPVPGITNYSCSTGVFNSRWTLEAEEVF